MLMLGSCIRRSAAKLRCQGVGFVASERSFATAAPGNDTSEVTIELPADKFGPGHEMKKFPDPHVKTSRAELLAMYESMQRMRRMEITLDMLYKSQLIRGFCHLYDGQEAIAEGIHRATSREDSIITSYRDHCIHLIRGGTMLEVIAELMGRTTGASKGLGGSMHMYKKDHNFYGGHGIVGAQIPVGTGLALKHKIQKDGGVTITMLGDGAINQGQFSESINMAALQKLPCIYLVENNKYGMGTSVERAGKLALLYERGNFVPGLRIDGMDALAMKASLQFAKDYVRESGPLILECMTYRYHGHSMSDPGTTYRTREEIKQFREEKDPIDRIKRYGTNLDIPSDAYKEIDKRVKKEVEETVEAAKASPFPCGEELATYVYAKPIGVLRGKGSGQWVANASA